MCAHYTSSLWFPTEYKYNTVLISFLHSVILFTSFSGLAVIIQNKCSRFTHMFNGLEPYYRGVDIMSVAMCFPRPVIIIVSRMFRVYMNYASFEALTALMLQV